MVAGGLVRLAGKALGPKMLAKFGGARGVNQIFGDVAGSAAINAALIGSGQLARGEFDPLEHICSSV